ncbi:MAG: hypothetical protein M3282_04560 [Gemmatimonadota bacterium]|nr:hypothetical protein [Gemmatimonadota bacterium]
MRLKGTHRYHRALAFLLAIASIPAVARAQSGHAGHGQHDHGGKAAPAPTKPTVSTPAKKRDGDQVVSAADESMGGHAPGDMNSRFHMEMTPTRPATREDSIKAERLLDELRQSIAKYRDTAVAVADGYKMFMPNIKTQRIYHFTNGRRAFAEAFRFDPAKPTSLLYRRGADGDLELYGAMYTAPKRVSVDRLDERVPLSIARWHKHVNWCVPKRGQRERWLEKRDGHPVFGPQSPIATREACDEVGGRFFPSPLGWMVHVNAFADDPKEVWVH